MARTAHRWTKVFGSSGVYRPVRFEPMEYASRLEHDGLLLLDMTAAVRRLKAQPETFDLRIAGRGRRYTPDAFIELRDGSIIWIEIKTSDYLFRHPDLDGRRGLIEAVCALRGGRFLLWTEREIRRQPRWQTAWRLRFAVGHVTPERTTKIHQICATHGFPVPLGHIMAQAADDPRLVEAALGLCAQARLTIDLNQAVTAETLLLPGPDR